MTERAVWIDGTGLIYRAYKALPTSLCTPDGEPTNAVYGFVQMFRRILRGRAPTVGAVVFDAPGGSHRNQLDASYKAHRPPMPAPLQRQLAAIDDVVRVHGFPFLRVPGVEADDVLASLTRASLQQGLEVTVVSSDKDLLQLLVDPRVRVFDPIAEVSFHGDMARRKLGVSPGQLADLLALAGDPADGIPGVPGIGRASAVELLQTHGSVEAALLAEGDSASLRRLRAHAEQARRSKELATLHDRVELPEIRSLAVTPPEPSALNALMARFGFYSLLTAEVPRQPPSYFVCDTPEMAAAALANECQAGLVAVQVLQELDLMGSIAGIALCPRPGFALYFPLRGQGAVVDLGLLRAWLEDPERPKVAHDAKQAITALAQVGIQLQGVIGDTQLAAYLMDPTRGQPHRLEQVARRVLKRALQPLKSMIGSGRDQRRFDALTTDRAGAYACHLADAVLGCWQVLEAELDEDGLLPLLADDLELGAVLARAELHGIAVDPDVLRELGEGFRAERTRVEQQVHALAGHPFNIGSSKQLGTVLFDELGLPVRRRTKTGYSTAAEVLDQLDHPIVALVKRWRTLDVLLHTYTEVLVDSVRPTGRIHCTFQLTASATGRVITTAPDLQRTPVRSPEFRRIRDAFVAPAGRVLLSADWSQFELRVLAHLCGDPELVAAFHSGADLHRRTAAALFDVPEASVTVAEREIGKTVNFATVYGQGPTALAEQLGVPHREARAYIERFFEHYRGVRDWRDRTLARAYQDGFVSTIAGRRRFLPELSIHTRSDRAYGERLAMNSPVQGSAADLCRQAMVAIDRRLRARGLDAALVLQIHDELLYEVSKAHIDEVEPLVRHEMSTIVTLRVPLAVSCGVGRTWAEAHPD